MATTCPSCGATAKGKFCAQCGTPLDSQITCTRCGNPIPDGGRFCNMCGTSVARVPAPAAAGAAPGTALVRSPNLPWYIAGVSLLALIVAIVVPQLGGPEETLPAGPPIVGPMGDPSAIDLTSMTPEEAAGRLFSRVMTAIQTGDTAQARTFAPMAISAYGAIQPPTFDVRYRIAVLNLVAGNAAGARAIADEMMQGTPNHLFALVTAAQAETLMGNRDEARSLYQRFLDSYDSEMASGREEYANYPEVLPAMREEAERIVATP